MDKDFLKTNGDFVKIGGILIKTNSPSNTDEFKQYMWRVHLLDQIMNSGTSNATDELVQGALRLIKDYPKEANGYQFIMAAAEDYEYEGRPEKARSSANELVEGPAPANYKAWAKGLLNRLDSSNQPVSMQFTAIDGREVDLAKMRGKVVLVDFWGTHCGPCVAELPRIKAAWDNFQARGFEVIGISCDTDRLELEKFITSNNIPWPQFFDGNQQEDNRFTVAFGVDGIPHMFLVDKRGLLRFDNVRARDDFHPKGDTTSLEEKIAKLLAED